MANCTVKEIISALEMMDEDATVKLSIDGEDYPTCADAVIEDDETSTVFICNWNGD